MKKLILASLITLSGLQQIFASSPCTTGFALGYAIARQDYYINKSYCDEKFALPEWCYFEAQMIVNQAIGELFIEFNACCCANNYRECCN